ncbi:MAG: hypothetical protein AYK18_07975 [Theionarchaea archaeon DG-70]|nr:MAG: hypothetical protein AYK18_07975 [Theionarchaea archaeon DG-70]
MRIKIRIICFVFSFAVCLLFFIIPRAERKETAIQAQYERYSAQNKLQILKNGENDDKVQDLLQHENLPSNKIKSDKILYFSIEGLKNILHGELGQIVGGQRITEATITRFLVTLTISLAALIPALFISLLLALVGYKHYMNQPEKIVYLLSSVPGLFLGYLLSRIFGSNFLIAVVVLGSSCSIINEICRILENMLLTELAKDCVDTASAKRLTELFRPFSGTDENRTFRNALITVIPKIFLLFLLILSGSMIVEQVFRFPGLSYMLIDGLADKATSRLLIVIILAVGSMRFVSIMANYLYMFVNYTFLTPIYARDEKRVLKEERAT